MKGSDFDAGKHVMVEFQTYEMCHLGQMQDPGVERDNKLLPGGVMKNRVGIKQIAEVANVSIGTVDRALNGRSGISNAIPAQFGCSGTLERPYKS